MLRLWWLSALCCAGVMAMAVPVALPVAETGALPVAETGAPKRQPTLAEGYVVATAERAAAERRTGSAVLLVSGTALVIASPFVYSIHTNNLDDRDAYHAAGWAMLGSGLVSGGMGLIARNTPSQIERDARAIFAMENADEREQRGRLFLEERAHEARRARISGGISDLALAAGWLIAAPVTKKSNQGNIIWIAVLTGSGIGHLCTRTWAEKAYVDYEHERAAQKPAATVTLHVVPQPDGLRVALTRAL
jgi:hypothetical protein